MPPRLSMMGPTIAIELRTIRLTATMALLDAVKRFSSMGLAAEGFYEANTREGLMKDDHEFGIGIFIHSADFADFAAKECNRDQAKRKQAKAVKGEAPIDFKHLINDGDDSEGLGDDVVGNSGDRKLCGARIIRHPGNEAADLRLIKKIQGLGEDMAEDFDSQIVQDAKADPRHVVILHVIEGAAGDDNQRQKRADQHDVAKNRGGLGRGRAQPLDATAAASEKECLVTS